MLVKTAVQCVIEAVIVTTADASATATSPSMGAVPDFGTLSCATDIR